MDFPMSINGQVENRGFINIWCLGRGLPLPPTPALELSLNSNFVPWSWYPDVPQRQRTASISSYDCLFPLSHMSFLTSTIGLLPYLGVMLRCQLQMLRPKRYVVCFESQTSQTEAQFLASNLAIPGKGINPCGCKVNRYPFFRIDQY